MNQLLPGDDQPSTPAAHRFSDWLNWMKARIIFYPTLWWNMLLGRWLKQRNWYDFITPHVIVGAYPFSNQETGHRVTLDGRVLNAMCAVDALGIGAMTGRDIAIASGCRHCRAPIRITTRGMMIVMPIWSHGGSTVFCAGTGVAGLIQNVPSMFLSAILRSFLLMCFWAMGVNLEGSGERVVAQWLESGELVGYMKRVV